jgi:hypothetical protein
MSDLTVGRSSGSPARARTSGAGRDSQGCWTRRQALAHDPPRPTGRAHRLDYKSANNGAVLDAPVAWSPGWRFTVDLPMIDGLSKAKRSAADARDYRRALDYRAEYERRRTVLRE